MDSLFHVLSLCLLIGACLAAVLMTALRLPGTWLILLSAAIYAWCQDTPNVGWGVLAVLAGAAVAGEVIEFLMSAILARYAGASRHAQWAAIIGGILGMIFLSFLVPIPIVGSVAGALLGCCGGAALAEIIVRRRLEQGAKVGLFSGIGFALGTAAKTAVALAMSGLLLATIFQA